MESFHCPRPAAPVRNRFRDLLVEDRPVAEWLDAEEAEEGVQLHNVVLPGYSQYKRIGEIQHGREESETYRGVPVSTHRYFASSAAHEMAAFVPLFLML